jgi:hypothetical protein
MIRYATPPRTEDERPCGSWERVLKPSVLRAKSGGDGTLAVLLDPPYATPRDLYAHTEHGISEQVAEWCASAPDDLRVVLCGYDKEHDQLLEHGWSRIDGKSGGGAGYSTRKDNGRREGLWLSPACIQAEQTSLFELGGAS